MDTVVADLKAANTRRETESRILADQVQGMKDLIPKALEGWKAGGDARLDELSQELQSLKRLLENRVGRSAGTSTPTGKPYPSSANGAEKSRDNENTAESSNGSLKSSFQASAGTPAPAPGIDIPKREASSPKRNTPGGDRRAAIPAWQMAAVNKSGGSSTVEAGA